MLLIDGHNLASRAYWGMVARSNQSFCTSDGIPTTVCFGFLRSLAALLEQEAPHSLVVAFDAPAKSFRHEALDSYKAQRGPAPPGFTADLRNLQLLLRFMRVHTVSVPGYEADDVLAGTAQQAAAAGYTVRIYSSDQDLWQVVNDASGVAILAPISTAKGAPRPRGSAGQALTSLIDEAAVAKRLGVRPAQVPDYKALVGDSSDNLPGIPGIGPKTAAGLLQAWGSAEAVFSEAAMQAHAAGVQRKLQGQEQAAAMYKDLTILRIEAAPKLDCAAAALSGFCADELATAAAAARGAAAAAPGPSDLVVAPGAADAALSNVFFESKRCHNELHHWGLTLTGVEFDVLLAACLLDPEKWTEGRAGKQRVLDPQRQQHQALPAMAREQLRQLGNGGALLSLLRDVEVPVQGVLASMERAGIGADREALERQRAELQEELSVLESRLFELAGHPLNLASRQQLSRVIFQQLGVAPRDPKYSVPTTTTGLQSTKEEVLRQLEPHPFVDTYLQWAGLNTMLTKYYNDSYIRAVQGADPHSGRVHTTLVQVGGATGRINSANPNLQNIPVHVQGRHASAFRAAFNRPAPGYVLVSADYSQVELRVVAALAQEQALQQAFAEGRDVHEATARVLLDRQPGEPVDKEERQMGKRVNFSIVYGAGSSKIGKDAGLTPKQAQEFLKRFYNAYPSLFDYMTTCQRSAVARGHTSSVLGRRRLYSFSSPALQALRGSRELAALPDMKGLGRLASREDAEVLRQAGNAPIQGTSADILKVALLQLHSALAVPPWNCRILLTVHDSVVLEVPEAQWPAAAAEIARIMEGVLQQHQLHLKVDVKQGW
ncbi:hypothetical protein OEZ85_008149 [Tetradesmus obliquus]|uniref:DNA-directed DNA polymerase n=1 Tax=Tetradesmus obliquus TaxID=3088 RepID=A0ABY8TI90_TETOB|nr:hypothetical protein OEZ85_008149 [Tetradesmus obliquus]